MNATYGSTRNLPKIVYVGGFGRSGSTLIGRVLGEAPNALCLGEARYVWTRGLFHNVECGCGKPFRSCPFWSEVGEAFGGWHTVDLERLVQVDRAILLLRTLPLHWFPFLKRGFSRAMQDYVGLLTKLYMAIGEVSQASTLVDTSKDPNFASLLMRVRGSDVRTIHLVRDSRAVAFSWTRNKKMPSPIGEQQFLDQFSPISIAPRWFVWNAALHALSMRNSPYIRIHYEQFVANPRRTLRELSSFASEPFELPAAQLTDHAVKLADHHMFSGNPMRARTGWVTIGLDDEWKAKMPMAQRAKVTAMTWPQLCAYGYPIFRSRPRLHSASRDTGESDG